MRPPTAAGQPGPRGSGSGAAAAGTKGGKTVQARARTRLALIRATEQALDRRPDLTVAFLRARMERNARRRTDDPLPKRLGLWLTIRAMDVHPVVGERLVRHWLERAARRETEAAKSGGSRLMSTYSAWRDSRPDLWLAVALVAQVATYATAAQRPTVVLPWLLLDLWLAFRIWKRGPVALACLRFLQVLATTLSGLALALSPWDDSLDTTVGPGTVALWAVSAWCLFAPALSVHTSRSREVAGRPT
jgi:hypothetical protein